MIKDKRVKKRKRIKIKIFMKTYQNLKSLNKMITIIKTKLIKMK